MELKKFAQYWKNNMFRYDFGNNLSNVLEFLEKKSFFGNQFLDTENLYNINKEFNSSKNKKVYNEFDENIIGINIIKLKIDEK